MRARKASQIPKKKVEEKPIVKIEEPIEEILPQEEEISTKSKRKKTLLELIEEEENKFEE